MIDIISINSLHLIFLGRLVDTNDEEHAPHLNLSSRLATSVLQPVKVDRLCLDNRITPNSSTPSISNLIGKFPSEFQATYRSAFRA